MDDKKNKVTPDAADDDEILDLDDLSAVSGGRMLDDIVVNKTTKISFL